jgi:MHS family alpha-ketoglutarate permease-like MFS transporter
MAPFLLLVARVAQGFSTGGQYGATASYLSEIASANRRGFFASFQHVTLLGGQLLALVVLMSIQLMLSEEAIRDWGWRIPFGLGAVVAASVIWLRNAMHETAGAASRKPGAGTLRALARHSGALFIVTALTAGGAIVLYTFTTYMQKFLVNTAGMNVRTVSAVMTGALIVTLLLQPVIGSLSDRIGRRACLLIFTGTMTVAAVPLLQALSAVADPVAAFALVLTGMAILSFYTSISGLFKAELFPIEVRALGVGLAHSSAAAVFGGSAEYVALWFKQAGREVWFFWYVAAVCLVSFLVAALMRDPRRVDMAA